MQLQHLSALIHRGVAAEIRIWGPAKSTNEEATAESARTSAKTSTLKCHESWDCQERIGRARSAWFLWQPP